MVQIFSASEDIDLVDVMDNVEELYNHDWDQKIRFYNRNGEISGTDSEQYIW